MNFERKFRTQGLDRTDEAEVLKAIVDTRDTSKLLSYLYIYGYSFSKNEKIFSVCDYYIRNAIPGLTAVCMRVVIDYWGYVDEYHNELEKFLNIDLFEEWYDEVIFTVSFICRNKSILFPDSIREKYNKITSHPEIIALGLKI